MNHAEMKRALTLLLPVLAAVAGCRTAETTTGGPAPSAAKAVCGVGMDASADARQAGAAAARQALAGLGGERPRCTLVFDSYPAGDREALLAGVAAHIDAQHVFGCPAAAPFTSAGARATSASPAVAVLVLAGSEVSVATARTSTEDASDLRLSAELLARALPRGRRDRLTLVLGDCAPPGAADVVEGLKTVLGTTEVIVGGAAGPGEPAVYFQGRVMPKTVVAISLDGAFVLGSVTRQGGAVTQTEQGVVDSARSAAQALVDERGRAPSLALALSAPERRAALAGPNAELAALQQVLGPGVPIVGFYAPNQIGPPNTGMPALSNSRHLVLCGLWFQK
jgi:hypothetical protein